MTQLVRLPRPGLRRARARLGFHPGVGEEEVGQIGTAIDISALNDNAESDIPA
ncbi:MAG TPA: hypothetical protein VFR37_09045 [Longimicrobium sp.]|nr:hypothetical protein [Longimicrobium sp.]